MVFIHLRRTIERYSALFSIDSEEMIPFKIILKNSFILIGCLFEIKFIFKTPLCHRIHICALEMHGDALKLALNDVEC